MPTKQRLSPSMEDYLEVIYGLVKENRVARVRDIADILAVTMPSVTGALKKLSTKGLVNYDPHEVITLTPEGQAVAGKLAHAHRSIASFLTEVLNVPPEIADKNACRMEHAIDDVVLTRLIRYIEFVEKNPGAGARFSDEYGRFCPEGSDPRAGGQGLTDRLQEAEYPDAKKQARVQHRSAKT